MSGGGCGVLENGLAARVTRRNNNEVWFAWSVMPGNGF
jgi:hypothetical protein